MKRINERYGHQVGDECLKRVAQTLSYMIRSNDIYITDVRKVQEELREQIQKQEAYRQDYETFKSIYRFLERGIARSGQKACVILLTVVDGQGRSPLPYEKDMLMEQLVLPCGNSGEFSTCSLRQCCVVISQRCHRIASFFRLALTQISGTAIHRYFRKAVLGEDIGVTLRIGDVYTRYSSSQYLLLVIDTTEEKADRIVDRIRERFLDGRQGEDVLIHHCYELQPAQSEK